MYEIFVKLLQERGISVYKLCKDTGISQATISKWKTRNSSLSNELARKIANYFGVSVDYLMTGITPDIAKETYYLNDETTRIAQEIFENRDLRMLFDSARDSSPEDLRTIHAVLLALKNKEKGRKD